MKRAAVAIVLTLVGMFYVLSFKTSPAPALQAIATPEPAASDGTRSGTYGTPPPTPVPTRTVNGPVETMRWGPVQVAVTLRGSKIEDVNALVLPTDHPRSAYISQQVAPMLRYEVLQAQGANIQTISGATYTSVAYANSLQSALDNASAGTVP